MTILSMAPMEGDGSRLIESIRNRIARDNLYDSKQLSRRLRICGGLLAINSLENEGWIDEAVFSGTVHAGRD